ncbi:hypothetical protein [Pleurocapsa sp. PCC 7319]|uniref:hypothetical protein n=1 Tax=Pleurocapsa sp. PCC 7319 TaxID=118161 RepID=UPI00037806E8|nr:hypothetical protein [Pleurocapsa sp. PCC 7319]
MKLFKKSTSSNSKKSNNKLGLIACITILGFLLTPIGICKCLAFSEIEDINTPISFQPPPEEKQPEFSEGAGSRGESSHHDEMCSQDLYLSQQQKTNADRLYQTADVAENPTFWFDLPKTSAQQIILSTNEEDINPNWQQLINLTDSTTFLCLESDIIH